MNPLSHHKQVVLLFNCVVVDGVNTTELLQIGELIGLLAVLSVCQLGGGEGREGDTHPPHPQVVLRPQLAPVGEPFGHVHPRVGRVPQQRGGGLELYRVLLWQVIGVEGQTVIGEHSS